MASIQTNIISIVTSALRPVYDPFSMQEDDKATAQAAGKAIRERLVKWITDKNNRASVYSALWVVLVALNCLLSVALFGISHVLGIGVKAPAVGTAILWGLLFWSRRFVFSSRKSSRNPDYRVAVTANAKTAPCGEKPQWSSTRRRPS